MGKLMFNGIVRQTGVVKDVSREGSKMRLGIQAPSLLRNIPLGDSVAVNGVCLTVSKKIRSSVSFDVVSETQKRTALGGLIAGQEVNLERPMKWGERVSGHFVLGHVDGIGQIIRVEKSKSQTSFLIRFPKNLKRYIVEKGSIAVDGVSLTLGKVRGNTFWIHLIPHSLQNTNFKHHKTGNRVNLEVDYIAKLAIS
jgi:riboflavin synthase